MHKHPLKQNLKDIFSIIKNNKLIFALICLLDLTFLVALLFSSSLILANMLAISKDIVAFMNSMPPIGPQTADQPESYQAIADMFSTITDSYSALIMSVIILAVSTFVIWLVFQSISYFISSKMLDEKTKFWKYIGKFFLFSLFFYILIVLSFYSTTYLSMANSKIVIPLFSQGIINAILLLLLSIISYFFFISLSLIRAQKIIPAFLGAFKLGVKKFFYFILIYLAIMLLYFILIFILYSAFFLNIILFYLLILLIFIPVMSLSRILFLYFSEKISHTVVKQE
jgi:hypothetical protein